MSIYVCVKHVPDSAATITIRDGRQIDETITFLLNPYDENAVEAAVRQKAQETDAEVVAVTLGKAGAENTLRSALAMGADRGLHILTAERQDSMVTARALAAAIRQDGVADIIFTGKAAIDSEGWETQYRLAAVLDLPVVSNVTELSREGQALTVVWEGDAGALQTLKVPLPCVIGASKALNRPRYPTLPDIIKARKKKIRTVDLAALDLGRPAGVLELLDLQPAVENRRAKILAGSPEVAVDELVRLLREEAKVI